MIKRLYFTNNLVFITINILILLSIICIQSSIVSLILYYIFGINVLNINTEMIVLLFIIYNSLLIWGLKYTFISKYLYPIDMTIQYDYKDLVFFYINVKKQFLSPHIKIELSYALYNKNYFTDKIYITNFLEYKKICGVNIINKKNIEFFIIHNDKQIYDILKNSEQFNMKKITRMNKLLKLNLI